MRHNYKLNENRQTTYKSLCGVVGLLYAEDEESFAYYYNLATHDYGGYLSWGMIKGDYIKKWMHEKYLKRKGVKNGD